MFQVYFHIFSAPYMFGVRPAGFSFMLPTSHIFPARPGIVFPSMALLSWCFLQFLHRPAGPYIFDNRLSYLIAETVYRIFISGAGPTFYFHVRAAHLCNSRQYGPSSKKKCRAKFENII